jgi:two-component system sensor histidine kinase YesM
MNFLKKLSIRRQLILLAVITMSTVLVIICMIYVQTSGIITDKNGRYTSDMLTQVRQGATSNCDMINNVLTSIAYNPTVQDYFMETDRAEKFELIRKMDSIVGNAMNIVPGLIDIIMLDENGNSYSFNGNVELIGEWKDRFTRTTRPYYSPILALPASNTKCIAAGSVIYSIDSNRMPGARIGVAAALIDLKVFGSDVISDSVDSLADLYVLDRSGDIIYSRDAGLIGSKPARFGGGAGLETGSHTEVIDNRKYIIQVDELPQIGGKIVSIIPRNAVLEELAKMGRTVFLILLLTLLVLAVPFAFIINNIVRPLNKLMSFFVSVQSGRINQLKKRILLDGNTEVSVMAREFNGMLDEIDGLTHRLVDTTTKLYRSELEKKQSELAFLQSQINPHFLYNTLESISGLAIAHGVGDINKISTSLGHIFRYSIKGGERVSLKEELDIVAAYVKIQQIRFAGRFEFETEITPGALECEVLKMILQPIVENAVYHGLETKLGKGLLSMSGYIDENGDLRLCVSDDGTGMDKESLEELVRELNRDQSASLTDFHASIGLMNVNNRIRLIYGDKYGIEVNSVKDLGTQVLIRLPARGKKDVQGIVGG